MEKYILHSISLPANFLRLVPFRSVVHCPCHYKRQEIDAITPKLLYIITLTLLNQVYNTCNENINLA